LICSPGECDYRFNYQTNQGEFVLDTREVKNVLGDVPITHPDVRSFLRDMFRENLAQIKIVE